MRTFRIAVGLFMLTVASAPVYAQDIVRIGVLNDQSGPYADLNGHGSTVGAELAVEDFGGTVAGMKIEILVGDHQNKPDLASGIARGWFDSGVDAIADLSNSGAALAVSSIARDANKVGLASGATSKRFTGDACSANTLPWTVDTFGLANTTGKAVVREGGTDWYFLAADYVFGADLQAQTTRVVEAAGGKVVGSAKHPLGNSDFSSYLLAAQASGAKILGISSAGADAVNVLKASSEFRIADSGMRPVALAMFMSEVHAVGLDIAQGLLISDAFYWDLNDRTRKFSQRFSEKMDGKKPTVFQAGVYSQVLHYLKAVQKIGSAKDGKLVVETMKSLPVDDDAFGPSTVRKDGRRMIPMYTFKVKSPAESKGPWDYYQLISTTAPEDAWAPLDPACPLAK